MALTVNGTETTLLLATRFTFLLSRVPDTAANAVLPLSLGSKPVPLDKVAPPRPIAVSPLYTLVTDPLRLALMTGANAYSTPLPLPSVMLPIVALYCLKAYTSPPNTCCGPG